MKLIRNFQSLQQADDLTVVLTVAVPLKQAVKIPEQLQLKMAVFECEDCLSN